MTTTMNKSRLPHLLSPFDLRGLTLRNRVVMAPLTRARAGGERLPNDLMAEYYTQRASAGLIITEATVVSEQGFAQRVLEPQKCAKCVPILRFPRKFGFSGVDSLAKSHSSRLPPACRHAMAAARGPNFLGNREIGDSGPVRGGAATCKIGSFRAGARRQWRAPLP